MIVTAANVSDYTIGMDLLDQATTAHPTLAKTWVDAGFKNRVVEHHRGCPTTPGSTSQPTRNRLRLT